MLSMLVILVVWTMDVTHTNPLNEESTHLIAWKKPFSNRVQSEFTNLNVHKEEIEIDKTNQVLLQKLLKYPHFKIKGRNRTKAEVKKRCHDDDADVVDRADHVSQFLADLFVNTDEEITAQQAIEPEGNIEGSDDYSDKDFFDLLRRREANETIYHTTPDPT